MWAPRSSAFFYTRPLLALPAQDALLVALQRAAIRLLATETHGVQDPSDVVPVVPHVECPLDDLGDPGRGPKLCAVPMRHRPLEQEPGQFLLLPGVEARRTTRRDPNLVHPVLLPAPPVTPAHDRAGGALDPAGHVAEGQSLIEQIQCPSSPVSDQVGRSLGSHPSLH